MGKGESNLHMKVQFLLRKSNIGEMARIKQRQHTVVITTKASLDLTPHTVSFSLSSPYVCCIFLFRCSYVDTFFLCLKISGMTNNHRKIIKYYKKIPKKNKINAKKTLSCPPPLFLGNKLFWNFPFGFIVLQYVICR